MGLRMMEREGRVELIVESTGDSALVEGADLAGEGATTQLRSRLRWIVLRQFPEIPDLRHFPVPLQQQQQVVRGARRAAEDDVNVNGAVCDSEAA